MSKKFFCPKCNMEMFYKEIIHEERYSNPEYVEDGVDILVYLSEDNYKEIIKGEKYLFCPKCFYQIKLHEYTHERDTIPIDILDFTLCFTKGDFKKIKKMLYPSDSDSQ